MKKKIVIWVCLAVVLAISIIIFVYNYQSYSSYMSLINSGYYDLQLYSNIVNNRLLFMILSIVNAIITLLCGIIICFFQENIVDIENGKKLKKLNKLNRLQNKINKLKED